MKLSEFKQHLAGTGTIDLKLHNGSTIPAHFHITEAGLVTKNFIDCGGRMRSDKSVNFQVWVAQDEEHRLTPEKLLKIISIYENLFGAEDLEVEMEYQTDTIGRYGVEYEEAHFILMPKHTDCLAKENCGVPVQEQKMQLAEMKTEAACCAPGGGCC